MRTRSTFEDHFTGIFSPRQHSDFEDEYDVRVPTEGEVRIVANRNRQCQYYYSGIEYCRRSIIQFQSNPENSKYQDGFLPCKKLVDAYYTCLTDNSYGATMEEAPEVAQPAADKFLSCAFSDLRPIQICKKYFNDVLRTIYRMPDTRLDDSI